METKYLRRKQNRKGSIQGYRRRKLEKEEEDEDKGKEKGRRKRNT